MTIRHCLALDLNCDAASIAQYEAWHASGAVPLAVTRSIRAADIREMEIWRAHDRLFMIMEVGPNFSPEAHAQADMTNEEVHAWERLMWTFQKALPDAEPGEKWVSMRQIFSLSEQK
jgi:L-rhamnose mutarotase